MTKLTSIACALAMLVALSATGCKKDDKGGKGKAGTSAGKTTTAPTPTPTPEAPKWTSDDSMKVFHACWEAFNSGALDKLGACYGDTGAMVMVDFQGPPMNSVGSAAVVKTAGMFRTAFPDMKGDLQLVIANGNKVAAIGIESGTNSGEMMGMPATNKAVSMLFAQVVHIDDKGKVGSDWHLSDQSTEAHQLGMYTPPKGAPPSPTSETAWDAKVMAAASDADKAAVDSNVSIAESFSKAIDSKDMATIKAHTDENITFRYAPHAEAVSGAEAYYKGLGMYHGMFDSLERKVTDSFGAGDWVVIVSSNSKKIAVDMPNAKKVKTKGKEINATAIEFFEIADTKVKQHWVFENSYAFAIQAGLAEMPKMPDPGMKKDADEAE